MFSNSLKLTIQRSSVSLLTLCLSQTAQAAPVDLFFSEYVEGSSAVSSYNKALEIYNGTGATIVLTGNYMIEMYYNGKTTADLTIPLSGTILSGDVFVVRPTDAIDTTIIAQADQSFGSGWFNGNDAIVLKKANGTPLDVIGKIKEDPGTEWGSGFTSTADNTLRRKPTVCHGDTNPDDVFDPANEWDGFPQNTFSGLGSHTYPTTKIHTLQGNGITSPEVGNVHIIQGVVVGDFQANTQLNGFFVQEEDSDADTDPTTSEGIFVYDNNFGVDVSVGQVVRVQGKVQEFNGLTELANVTSVSICGDGASVTPTTITLPLTSNTFLERYEGMLVKLPQTLTVTDNYNLGRYGEVVLANGRLLIPTMTTTPGTAANTLQAQNDLNRLLLDDGSLVANPPLISYPSQSLSATHTLRNGDTVTGVTGVLDYSFGQYRLHPTSPPAFVATNPRPSSPAAVGGTLKIASFNVDNYFNTFSGCYVSCRGAENATEFTRQRNKIINALKTIDADIVGLMEVENDGYDASSALQDLVNGLNAVTSSGTYAFIDADAATEMTNALGYDAIKVAMLYKPAIVTLVGSAKSLNTGAFASQNRPPLAQTFQQIATGGKLTVVVNHFKSRGSNTSGNAADNDQGDGQGMSNATRTAAARDLTAWLATDPTGSGDSNFLLIGDLNAYALEDPLMVIKSAGYTDLVQKFMGANAYSYIYDGQAGYIDHASASASLLPRVTGVTEWHIDADEPSVLDYNQNDKSAGQLTSLYNADPYRASDHDPLIIGLSLPDSPPAVISTTPPNGATHIAIDADIAIGFNESVKVTDSSFAINCSSSGVHSMAVSGNGANYTLNPSSDFANNDTCVVTVLATQVSDTDTNDPPDKMTTDYNWHFTTAPPPPTIPSTYLFVSLDGQGKGRVTSQPQGIDCEADKCQYPFDLATQVTLTPIPAEGSKFSSWGGDTDCADGEVILTSNKLCIAFFALLPPPPVTLTVTKSGTGTGVVTSVPTGIDCGTTCKAAFSVATPVTLQVTPDANSQFIGFSGDADCSDGNVTLNTAATCNVLFELQPTVTPPTPTPVTFNLTLQVTGNGSVTSSPAGIDCGTTCTADYLSGTPVTLTALPAEGYQFAGFTGDNGCVAGQFNLATNVTCIANFTEVVTADLPQFAAPHYEIPANAKILTIAIQRPTSATSLLTVNYATQDGTAIAGRDYVATTGNVTWPEGDKADKIITITLLRGEQKVVTEAKIFSLVLTDAKGTQLDTATVSLLASEVSSPSLSESPISSSPQTAEPIPETTRLPELANLKTPELLPDAMPVPISEPVPTTTLTPSPSEPMPMLTAAPTIEELSNPVWLLDNPRCPTEGWLDWVCNAQWQTLHNLEIGIHGILSSGILEGTINNQGWVSNLIIKPQSLVIGGVVTGYITNQGQMLDFEFVGMSVRGGTLSGTIRNNSLVGGYFQDVHLAANTHLRGGRLQGDIIGDVNAPALLEDLVIAEGSRLVGVKIGKRVRLAKGVKY